MDTRRSRQIVIAGAGIAGLTAAIAFAKNGFSVQLFEQAPQLEDAGSGIQLSPNATRVLAHLGVLEHLIPSAVEPRAVVVREARKLRRLAEVPLGSRAEDRWGAPYLVAHRADLQTALLARAKREPDIRLVTGARLADAAFHPRGVTVSIDVAGDVKEAACLLLVGADGVGSTVRNLGTRDAAPNYSGFSAWRSTVRANGPLGQSLLEAMPADCVTVYAHKRFHLVAYPIRGGTAVNLVVIVDAKHAAARPGETGDTEVLARLMRGTAAPLATLAREAAPWSLWPIREVPPDHPWTGGASVALIGDAAHALTPFAAQGAAMAMEDAIMLANLVAATPDDIAGALARYEAVRRPRIKRVEARGRFNHFAWHASGPIALARNLILRGRSGRQLAAELDWLYGFDACQPPKSETKAAPPA
ncbi:FAD-dependent monooxygenase [Mesorhizobium sp. Z1-4]|uniref:FAD-dependent monooxygenase n=1 Tax=Mesorhizobium sp. Z1-4 TaxID=2448478 RepID=UPI000FDA56E4|nr:FAD-dependent monooxygenase [Mesorhizobium sp. Z1-4]